MNILFLIMAYLVGSIPFSYIIPKLMTGMDVRQYGSKNVGASNAVYTTNFKVGVFCFIGDFFKGFIVYFTAFQIMHLNNFYVILGSLLVIAGHNWSIFLKFKGGKGIATAWGVMAASNPIAGILFFVFSALVTLTTKYIGLGNVVSIFMVYAVSFFDFLRIDTKLIFFIFILILPKHIENFVKIYNGTELKINARLGKDE
ncbi:MAG TPA: glycerol-3-phosphate 1-O-acyltransferase PlsY [Tepiditoga sp.]|nr:glycerol-3-phosphate 1-O-acyltransferase PlsY [Tepiditoga sp.]